MLSMAVVLLVLLAIGMPVAFVLGLTGLWTLIAHPYPLEVLANRMVAGVNQFVLLAIPFFMMAGELMNRSGITDRLVRFSVATVGRARGGLAHANVFSSLIFSGMSGTAVGDVAALGSIFIPAMEKEGYHKRFAAAVTAASSIVGPIIPPSIVIIIYGSIAGVSIGGLFAAAIVPGLLITITDFAIVHVISHRRNYPKREEKITALEYLRTTRDTAFALIMPVIILGGIISGIFTPTEAAAVAVAYAFIIAFLVYRKLRLRDVSDIFFIAGIRSSIVLLIISAASLLGWLLSVMGVPRLLTSFLLTVTTDPTLAFFLVILILLFIGTFMEPGAAIILLTPILAPVLHGLGFHPIHVGIVIIMTLNLGLCTPPVGAVLFTAQSVSGVKMEEILADIWPFLLVDLLVIILLVLFPQLLLFIPQALGLA